MRTSLKFGMYHVCKVVQDDFQIRNNHGYQDIWTNVKHLKGRVFVVIDWERDTINDGMTRKNSATYTLVELEAGDLVKMNSNGELFVERDDTTMAREQFEVHCSALDMASLKDLEGIRGSLLGKSIGIV